MDDKDSILRRYGGHLALLLVAILLFLVLTNVPKGELFNLGLGTSMGEPAVAELADKRLAQLSSVPDAEFAPADLTGVPLLVSNSLSPHLNPITFEGKRPEQSVITYTVQANDTPIGISLEFGIKPETLLGGNAFLSEEASALQTGNILIILPVDGVLHDVRDGDSLEKLANQYGVSVEDIIAYEPNNLEFPYRLYPDTQ